MRRHRIMDIQELPVAGTALAFLQREPLTLEDLTHYPLAGLSPSTTQE